MKSMAPPQVPRQLVLSLRHAESHAREDFLVSRANSAALALIESWPDWASRVVVLAGPPGAGKSHLASIWAQISGARIVGARALRHDDLPVALTTGALVLEDLAPGDFDGPVLFHLLNLARENGVDVMITTRTPPALWTIGLPDLASRLRALPVVTMEPPDDALLRAVIAKLMSDRQIAAEPALLDFLILRIERNFEAARAVVERLDREALRLRRPVSRTLAADLLRAHHD